MRKPADAEAYKQTTLATAARDVAIRQAEAEAQQVRLHAAGSRGRRPSSGRGTRPRATRLNGQADADAIRARGMAEADAVRARMEAEASGIERRAAALSQNQEAVIAQQIAENLPAIVQAAASPFEHVGSFTVLNGAEGVTGALAQIIQQAGALSGIAREALMPKPAAMSSSNGHAKSTNGTPTSEAAAAANGKRAKVALPASTSTHRPSRRARRPRSRRTSPLADETCAGGQRRAHRGGGAAARG